MKLLVLGASGTLGTEVFREAEKLGHDVQGTGQVKVDWLPEEKHIAFDAVEDDIADLLEKTQPDVIINCLGIIKQADEPDDIMMQVNAEFPHALAKAFSGRIVHVSTDCAFSGKKGNYSEDDPPDPVDAYGLSKVRGELPAPNCTIRTSLIGFEHGTHRSLLEWFLHQPAGSMLKGYRKAVWSGLGTPALARVLLQLAEMDVGGLVHVSSNAVTKYELLQLFKEHFQHDVEIVPDDSVVCDRSLANEKLSSLGITVPSVEEMVQELAARR